MDRMLPGYKNMVKKVLTVYEKSGPDGTAFCQSLEFLFELCEFDVLGCALCKCLVLLCGLKV